MALELNFWEPDGPTGESCHHTTRIASIAEADKIIEDFRQSMSKGRIVLITLDRSDRQSHWSRILWIKPGYTEGTIRVEPL